MVQTSFAFIQPTAPPSSPNLSPSKCFITSSEIPVAHGEHTATPGQEVSKASLGGFDGDSFTSLEPFHPVLDVNADDMFDGNNRAFSPAVMGMRMAPEASRGSPRSGRSEATTHALKCICSHTPPSEATPTEPCSPTANQPSAQVVTTEHAQQFLDILKSLSTSQDSPPPTATDEVKSEEPPARASKLEFKTVNEVFVFRGT